MIDENIIDDQRESGPEVRAVGCRALVLPHDVLKR